MSQPTYDLDMSLWEAYLAECKAFGVKPTLSDYHVFLQEADLDRKEDYELSPLDEEPTDED